MIRIIITLPGFKGVVAWL